MKTAEIQYHMHGGMSVMIDGTYYASYNIDPVKSWVPSNVDTDLLTADDEMRIVREFLVAHGVTHVRNDEMEPHTYELLNEATWLQVHPAETFAENLQHIIEETSK